MFTKQEMHALPKGTQVVFVGVSEGDTGSDSVRAIPIGTIMTKAVDPETDESFSYCDFNYDDGNGERSMPMLEDEIAPLTK